MKAIKGNKAYVVSSEAEAKSLKAKGYDIYSDNGELKERASGKTVSADKYESVKEENAKLKSENTKLKEATKQSKKG